MSDAVMRSVERSIASLTKQADKLKAKQEARPWQELFDLQKSLPEVMAKYKSNPNKMLSVLDKMQADEKRLRKEIKLNSDNFTKWMDQEMEIRGEIDELQYELSGMQWRERARAKARESAKQ